MTAVRGHTWYSPLHRRAYGAHAADRALADALRALWATCAPVAIARKLARDEIAMLNQLKSTRIYVGCAAVWVEDDVIIIAVACCLDATQSPRTTRAHPSTTRDRVLQAMQALEPAARFVEPLDYFFGS